MSPQSDYSTALTAYANYLAALKNGSTELKLSAAGTQYTGGTLIQPSNRYAGSPNECIALCSAISNKGYMSSCTGATYNSTQSSCQLYTGAGSIGSSTDVSSYAITSEIQAKLTAYNNAVIALSAANKALELEFSTGKKAGSILSEADFNAQTDKLQQTYSYLLQNRQNIDEAIAEYNELSNKSGNTSIGITTSSTQYIIWMIFAILVISASIVVFYAPNVNILETYPLMGLFIALLILYFAYHYIQINYNSFPNLSSYNLNTLNYYN
jgi:hypothetical protein